MRFSTRTESCFVKCFKLTCIRQQISLRRAKPSRFQSQRTIRGASTRITRLTAPTELKKLQGLEMITRRSLDASKRQKVITMRTHGRPSSRSIRRLERTWQRTAIGSRNIPTFSTPSVRNKKSPLSTNASTPQLRTAISSLASSPTEATSHQPVVRLVILPQSSGTGPSILP